MSVIDNMLQQLINATGDNATEAQSNTIVSFITRHYAKEQWSWAAEQAINVGDVYHDISERLGECGIY